MPVSPLAVAALLACARIGAVHMVVFAGFSSEALAGRIQDGKFSIYDALKFLLAKTRDLALELKQSFSLKNICWQVGHSDVLATFTAVRHQHAVSMVTDLQASRIGPENCPSLTTPFILSVPV